MVTVISNQPSAQTLRDSLQNQGGNDIIVCWGARIHTVPDGGGRVLNGRVGRLDGPSQLAALDQAGLTVPAYTTNLQEARSWVVDGWSVWGRRREHTQGTDIVGARHQAWSNREWWVAEVADVVREWRIHIFMGRVIGRGLKVQTNPPTRRLAVRSRRNGWTMVHDVDPPDNVRDAARQAVRAVGYDFGAVDILETADGPVVLEVNSAPALRSPITLESYKRAIIRCTEGKYKRWYTGDGYAEE